MQVRIWAQPRTLTAKSCESGAASAFLAAPDLTRTRRLDHRLHHPGAAVPSLSAQLSPSQLLSANSAHGYRLLRTLFANYTRFFAATYSTVWALTLSWSKKR